MRKEEREKERERKRVEESSEREEYHTQLHSTLRCNPPAAAAAAAGKEGKRSLALKSLSKGRSLSNWRKPFGTQAN